MHGLIKKAKLKPVSANSQSASRLGIGLEKLDRGLYDPTPVYDDLARIGAKWVRLQSGWCRTEKEKGIYDFTWLDEIVDNLLARGMKPWMCLCYGNQLYTPEADNTYGAVGRPPVKTPEERQAWCRYVSACVTHYRGRVDWFEIWNEPDGLHCWRHGANAAEYGEFARMTAQVIRKAQPRATILAGSFYTEISYVYDMLKTGLAPYIDYITYHRYKYRPDNGNMAFTRALLATIRLFSDTIGIIQGETGTQSQYSQNGALQGADWTEGKQAKFLLRKLVSDLATEVAFTSYFSAVDIFENIITDSGTKNRDYYGFFGVLGENFDQSGLPLGTYYQKPSYHAFQALCALMDGREQPAALPIYFDAAHSPLIGGMEENPFSDSSHIYTYGFQLPHQVFALAYWKGTDLLTTDYSSTLSAKAMGLPRQVQLVDLMDGTVYDLADDLCRQEGGKLLLSHLPLRDYPLLLVFGDIQDRCLPTENSPSRTTV